MVVFDCVCLWGGLVRGFGMGILRVVEGVLVIVIREGMDSSFIGIGFACRKVELYGIYNRGGSPRK